MATGQDATVDCIDEFGAVATADIQQRIETAAIWMVDHWDDSGQPRLRTLRVGFGLEIGDAVRAFALAKRYRAEAGVAR